MFEKRTQENEILNQTSELLNLTTQIVDDNQTLKQLLRQIILRLDMPEKKTEEKGGVSATTQKKVKTLRDLREEKGCSLREMANSIDCSKSIVSCWEQGVTKPPYTKIVLLANFFGYTISEIEKVIQATVDENFFKGTLNVTSLQNSLDLKGLRKKYNYSQKEVAKVLCMSQNAVSAWETGINRMTRSSMLMLSRLYDVTYEEVEMAAKKSYKGEY